MSTYARAVYQTDDFTQAWEKEDIITAKAVEEVDPTCETIPINTCDLTVQDSEGNFDVANPDGAWTKIRRNQQITITENLDGKTVECGKYFIDKWSSKDNTVTFNLYDAVGILDNITFSGGIYQDKLVKELVAEIMSGTGIKYELEARFEETTVSGYIPIESCRKALQSVCFAIGAIAFTKRSDTLYIYQPTIEASSALTEDRRFQGKTSVSLDSFISQVKVSIARYTKETAASQVFSGTLKAGDNEIQFSDPYDASTITCEGGTIKSAETNRCVVNLAQDGTATLSGIKYTRTEAVYIKTADKPEGEPDNIKSYTATLSTKDPLGIAERIMAYLSLRKLATISFLLENEHAGDWVQVITTDGAEERESLTCIYQQTIDLTGGYISDAKSRAYDAVTTANYFMDGELSADDDVII